MKAAAIVFTIILSSFALGVILTRTYSGPTPVTSEQPTPLSEELPSAPPRLAESAYLLLRGNNGGFDWASVWIVQDNETGAEYVIARTPEGISITRGAR